MSKCAYKQDKKAKYSRFNKCATENLCKKKNENTLNYVKPVEVQHFVDVF